MNYDEAEKLVHEAYQARGQTMHDPELTKMIARVFVNYQHGNNGPAPIGNAFQQQIDHNLDRIQSQIQQELKKRAIEPANEINTFDKGEYPNHYLSRIEKKVEQILDRLPPSTPITFEQHQLIQREAELLHLLEVAWGIIANVSEGNWNYQMLMWREAAEKWRDQYHTAIRKPRS